MIFNKPVWFEITFQEVCYDLETWNLAMYWAREIAPTDDNARYYINNPSWNINSIRHNEFKLEWLDCTRVKWQYFDTVIVHNIVVWVLPLGAYFTDRDWLNRHYHYGINEWICPHKTMRYNYSCPPFKGDLTELLFKKARISEHIPETTMDIIIH